ncbi:hypothetical protein LZC95_44065 [Pendulispora brunnea]|uniref:Uncharacterized protein n=1 Tax=Pendulispora brunnea TaxID=2905690 RepID=A0ABZ2K3Y9_9BACT
MRKLGDMRWYRIVLLASMVVAPFAACSLDEGGFGSAIDNPDGSITPDASKNDATSGDAGPGDANPNACPGGNFDSCKKYDAVFKDGWVPIGYRDDGTSCPTGFDALPRVTTPIAGGSCSCTGQTEVTGTKCRATELRNLHWNNNASESCNDTVTNPNITFPDGGCYPFESARIMNHFQATPLATSASCTLQGVPNDADVTAKTLKVCTSSFDSCKGVLCADKHVCIMHDGIVNDCPDEFGDPRTIGTGVELSCAKCNGTYSATCTGTASLFTDTACGTTPDSVLVDGTCNQVDRVGGGSARTYASLRYAPTVSDESCTPSGAAPKPSAKLAGPATVCCHD